ncbi:tyrosine-type recombinase/integrase [Baekduia soli]|uniref:tyrosine-type recombinase/integrase n=1 Tax=Baekduia soli TaxID=496014 RepID=UPI001651F417|nr:site-specific integrase [Baekduia soli]
MSRFGEPSGHVFRRDGVQSGPVWYAKYRLPDGRQFQRRIGPAWTQRGRPGTGYFTKRTAEAWLRAVMDAARAGTLPGMVVTNATVADACAEWLRWSEEERGCSPGTMRGRRSSVRAYFVPAFGDRPVEAVTTEDIERWRSCLPATLSVRTKNKMLTELHGVFRRAVKVWRLPANPVAEVEQLRERRIVDLEVYSPEEVMALVRAAASEQDAAMFLTAAFTGLRRGELIGLRWRDVDFPASLIRVHRSYSYGALTVPKSGKVRAVPLAPEVAGVLARLGQRGLFTGEEDLVFPGELGGFLDGSALRRRYLDAQAAAGVKRLRFHDLRHTFGTRMIAVADIVRVKEWMGHADIETTMRYLHFAPRPEDAALVAKAFKSADGDGHDFGWSAEHALQPR